MGYETSYSRITIHIPDEVVNVLVVVVDDGGLGDTVKLPVWIMPIVIAEPIASVITCTV